MTKLRRASGNIWEIIKGDFQRIRTNVVAWVIIVGLAMIPSLYAWYNIQASWDPYGNTGNLKIAIANDDAGYDGDLTPLPLNMGESLISSIQKNDSFNWIPTDSDTAVEGVKSGKYYAAIIIPKGFSNDLMSLFSSSTKQATIIYYSNEKENAIATKITDSGASAVQEKIDAVVTKTVVQVILNVVQKFVSDNESDRYTLNAVNGLMNTMEGVQQQLQAMKASVDALSASTDAMIVLLDSTSGMDASVSQLTKQMRDSMASINAADAVAKIADVATGQLKDDFTKLYDNLQKVTASTESVLDSLDAAGKDLSKAAAMTKSDMISLRDNLNNTSAALGRAEQSMASLISKLKKALADEDLETIRTILGEDSDELSSFISSPVKMDEKAVYPVANYGSAMAPFYTSLAIWVGGTILAAMLFVELSEERRRKLKNLTYAQEYIGRYVLFFLIGITQALIIACGDLWFLGIQCVHPVKFVLACLVSSIVFVNLAYTLTASFGDVGKAICVILLVIQVAGSGGTFPVEMEPAIFRVLYPLLPFAHSMPAMREAIAGCYGMEYWRQLGILLIYLVLSLFLGLVLRRPVIKLSRGLKEKLEDTKVI
ncbi:MAG: YhgE/Pip domain-containing protein [Clostridiales bacterium]|nr:YhgE/Pip domain-containing protein [Candidatus Crickella merdequi]